MKNWKWLGISITFIITVLFITFIVSYTKNSNNKKEIEGDLIVALDDSIKIENFEDSVYKCIKNFNISHPEVVLAQAKLESGNFQSTLFKKYNNMFGMKHPYKRPTLAIGKTESGYAIFNSWEDSIIDYAFFQVYSAKGLNKNDYIIFLNNYYAEDPNYDKKIINIINISINE